MWRKIRRHQIYPLTGVGIFIFGLPGMVDDWWWWQERQAAAPWWSGFISGVGAAMVMSWLIHIFGPSATAVCKWLAAFRRDPFRHILIRRAYRAPGNGIQIAKLIRQTRSVESAREIFDTFDGNPVKEGVAYAYAACAQALARFDCPGDAAAMLMALDEKGIPAIEIEEAKDRFFYPDEDRGRGK